MTDPMVLHPADGSAERAIDVERYGHETRRPKLGRTITEIALEVHHIERRSDRRLDHLGAHQVLELKSHRRGEWIYRATTYGVDPWDVLAYVGDATGAEAVRLSEEFLHQLEHTFDPAQIEEHP